MRAYMEMNREAFEKISQSNSKEEEKKSMTERQLSTHWEFLEKKFDRK